MIITCEKCNTQYMLKDGAIKEAGRNVKCAKCGHNWHQMPVEESERKKDVTPPPEKTEPIPEGSNLPVPTKQGVPVLLWISPFVLSSLMVVACLLFMPAKMQTVLPQAKMIYETLGLFQADGIVIEDMALNKKEHRKGTSIEIKANIHNTTDKDKPLPLIRIRLLDNDQKSIAEHTQPADGKVLKPGEKFPYKTAIRRLPKGAEYVMLDIGDAFELKLR